MCLRLNNFLSRKKVAKKDIIVYKGVMRDRDTVGGFKTYYRESVVEIGKTYKSELIWRRSTASKDWLRPAFVEVGLHSYAENGDHIPNIVVKCVIPKGSSYYKGTHCGEVSYASDRLTYVEVIQLYSSMR